MQPLDLLLLALATFYLSYIIANTSGPFGLIEKLRDRFPLGGLTTCIYCLSIWIAIVFYLLLQGPYAWIVVPFAAAGAAMLLYRYTGGSHVT